MRIPSILPMELLLILALFLSVMMTIFALRDPPGDRTRFTVEHTGKVQACERRTPPLVGETALGR